MDHKCKLPIAAAIEIFPPHSPESPKLQYTTGDLLSKQKQSVYSLHSLTGRKHSLGKGTV